MSGLLFDRFSINNTNITNEYIQQVVQDTVSTTPEVAGDILSNHKWFSFSKGTNIETQRQLDTVYTNTTGTLLRIWLRTTNIINTSSLQVIIDEGLPSEQVFTSGTVGSLVAGSHVLGAIDIMPSQTYKVTGRNFSDWKELRVNISL